MGGLESIGSGAKGASWSDDRYFNADGSLKKGVSDVSGFEGLEDPEFDTKPADRPVLYERFPWMESSSDEGETPEERAEREAQYPTDK